MPKVEPPPPRSAQYKSGWEVFDAWTKRPSAVTVCEGQSLRDE
jgi:hypothetical protein